MVFRYVVVADYWDEIRAVVLLFPDEKYWNHLQQLSLRTGLVFPNYC